MLLGRDTAGSRRGSPWNGVHSRPATAVVATTTAAVATATAAVATATAAVATATAVVASERSNASG